MEDDNPVTLNAQKPLGVCGKQPKPTQGHKIIEWHNRDDKTKSIITLVVYDSKLQHLDQEKSSKEIWDQLNGLFRSKALNAKFSLKTTVR